MTGTVRVRTAGAVALIALDNPPVNALSHAVRVALLDSVEQLDRDGRVAVIIIMSAGAHFAAGADIVELDAGARAPLLSDVLRRIEGCRKPVLAAMHGAVLGGGAELALACHYRGASSNLSFGFPEIELGLIPGAGGTLRLPRIVGVDTAIEMITSARRYSRAEVSALGLIDHVLEGDIDAAAVGWATSLIESQARARRTIDAEARGRMPLDLAAVRARVPRPLRHLPAVSEALEAVRIGLLQPPDDALADARERFERCRRSTESRALRHLFFAERQRPDETGSRSVASLGIVGAGTMGTGIALAAVLGGLAVHLVDHSPAAVERAISRIRTQIDNSCTRGRLSAEEGSAALARIRGGTSLDELATAPLILEAVVEDLSAKRALFENLSRIAAPQAVLATNTSTLDIDAIAALTGRRSADVVGMHFFSPAHVMRLVEIVPGRDSSAEALATVADVARRLGKIAVVVGNAFGFVGNRLLYAYGREKEMMLLQGVAPERIDAALEAFGMAMGPNAVGDLAGLDVGWRARRAWPERPADPNYWRATDRLAELGRLGRKSGRGFYRYPDGAASDVREPDPEAWSIVQAEAERLGVVQRAWTDAQIVERCVLALIRDGAHLIDERIARRASDIDVIWCNGYGFPRERGGPMFYGGTLGWQHVVQRMREFAAEPGNQYWAPPAYLERLAKECS